MYKSGENYDTPPTNDGKQTKLIVEGTYTSGDRNGITVSHEIDFGTMQIKRNYLYKVRIALEDPAGDTYGKVTHAINVKDWTSGVTLAWAGDENLYNSTGAANFTVTGTAGKLRDADGDNPERHLVLPYNAEKSATFYVTSTSTKSGLSLTCPATAVAATEEEGGGYQCTITPQENTYNENGEFIQKWQVTIRESALLPVNTTLTFTLRNALNSAFSTSFEVTGIDIKRNPLWWMAQYNMQAKDVVYASHSTASQNVWNFNDAKNITLAGYHLPSRDEQVSIIPSDVTSSDSYNLFSITNTSTTPYEFSEIGCVVGGNSVAATTSVFYQNATADYYAIRFIGTDYVSAWHYKWVTSPCAGLLIESYLLTDVPDMTSAKNKLTSIASSTVWEVDGYNLLSSKANLSPESTATTEYGYVQRFLPVSGYTSSASGTAAAASDRDVAVYYWSSTEDPVTTDNGLFMYNRSTTSMKGQASRTKNRGCSVRLFLNY